MFQKSIRVQITMSQNRQRAKPPRRRPRRSIAPSAPQSSSASDIAVALQLQQSGNLSQAKQIYLQVLEQEPRNADAWHLLGMALFAGGEAAEAIDCLQNANAIVPNHPDILANLGIIYRGLGDLEQAKIILQRAVETAPDSLAARNNLGTVLLELTDLDNAADQFEAALKLDPTFDNATMNLGNVRQHQGRLLDAESLYRGVLQRKPDDAMALNNLGETLRNQGKWSEATAALEHALLQQPNSVETRINLGRVLLNQFRNSEAQIQFTNLIESQPRLSKPYHYLGKALFETGDMPNALAQIEHSLELDPTDVYARSTLGFVNLEMGRSQAAADCFRKVIEDDPGMSEAHGCLLFVMSGDAEMDQADLFEEHKRWGKMHGSLEPLGPHRNSKQPDRRLRIGYVSPDLRRHAVANFFRPVMEMHDPDRVETFCYSEAANPDEMTEQLKQLSHHWRSTKGLSHEQVARQVMSDEIDILVDLAGHTSGNRLEALALRPAPIQVTWMGYPNTTGLESIDYRLTCETQNPVDEPTYHTEELIRMPHGSFCFSTPVQSPEIGPLAATHNGYITFGSLHRPFKISSSVRDLWANVLNAIPQSRMLIFNTRFTHESSDSLSQDLIQRGIATDRVEIRNEFDGSSYLDVYREIDIALDVSPWAGGTTTMEALWMGVPVVALNGQRRSARSTAAIMKNAGHADLVADSFEQYVKLATELATDIPRLLELRNGMRETLRKTLFNAEQFTRDLEKEYRSMWTRWCESN